MNPFRVPPFFEICRNISPLPSFGVPLNSMCSTQWEIPVMPGPSLREPTRYHTQKVATGEW